MEQCVWQYCLSNQPEVRPFEPEKTAVQEYPITSFQPIYYVAESFKDAKDKMSAFAQTIPRPFSIRYNPYTQTIDTIDNKNQIVHMVREVKSKCPSLCILTYSVNILTGSINLYLEERYRL